MRFSEFYSPSFILMHKQPKIVSVGGGENMLA